MTLNSYIYLKAINTKSVVLKICGKINHQQKNTFIICKQLNGPVLKSLKPSCLGRNRKKNMVGPGRAPAKILYFVSGWTGLGPRFQFLFWAGPGRARSEKIRPMQTSMVCYPRNSGKYFIIYWCCTVCSFAIVYTNGIRNYWLPSSTECNYGILRSIPLWWFRPYIISVLCPRFRRVSPHSLIFCLKFLFAIIVFNYIKPRLHTTGKQKMLRKRNCFQLSVSVPILF